MLLSLAIELGLPPLTWIPHIHRRGLKSLTRRSVVVVLVESEVVVIPIRVIVLQPINLIRLS